MILPIPVVTHDVAGIVDTIGISVHGGRSRIIQRRIRLQPAVIEKAVPPPRVVLVGPHDLARIINALGPSSVGSGVIDGGIRVRVIGAGRSGKLEGDRQHNQ